MICRHCGAELTLPFVDLGIAPPSNAYLTAESLQTPEKWYPLRVLVCTDCWLVQTEDFAGAEELFNDQYAYFSSCSNTWLEHARRYVEEMVARFDLTPESCVAEIAANDGYLLQYVKKKDIPCYGVEPTASTAAAAKGRGIEIVEAFFGSMLSRQLADEGKRADLITANNVLAHVPNINDFVSGVANLLKPLGVATFEFPHLMHLVAGNQFDTIYHEHFSYLSFHSVKRIFEINGLAVFDVEELSTHGGSLRVFTQHSGNKHHPCSTMVAELLEREKAAGLDGVPYYTGFQNRAERIKNGFLHFLVSAYQKGHTLSAYGAAAKGNTLLNFAGVRPDLLPFVVDRNPAKQGKFLPGSRIPIVSEKMLRRHKPDFIVILPWNLSEEITTQLDYVREWGAKFVIAVPDLRIF